MTKGPDDGINELDDEIRALRARIAEMKSLLTEARDVWLTLVWDPEDTGVEPGDEDSVANFKGRIDRALLR